jgi:amino acid transporter
VSRQRRRQRRPDPPPLQTNDVPIAMVGTAAWTVALLVLLIIGLPGPDRWWLWVCVVGIGIGLFGIWYIPRLHRGRAAHEARAAARRRPPDDS